MFRAPMANPGKRPVESSMSKVSVSVKWGKESFSGIEIDLDQPPLVFKSQLFTLTGVQPDRCAGRSELHDVARM